MSRRVNVVPVPSAGSSSVFGRCSKRGFCRRRGDGRLRQAWVACWGGAAVTRGRRRWRVTSTATTHVTRRCCCRRRAWLSPRSDVARSAKCLWLRRCERRWCRGVARVPKKCSRIKMKSRPPFCKEVFVRLQELCVWQCWVSVLYRRSPQPGPRPPVTSC